MSQNSSENIVFAGFAHVLKAYAEGQVPNFQTPDRVKAFDTLFEAYTLAWGEFSITIQDIQLRERFNR